MTYQVEDLLGDVSQGTQTAALTYEAFRDTAYKAYFFSHSTDDSLHMRFQVPHGWQLGTNFGLHIHWAPMVDPSASPQVVVFDGYYVFCKLGEVIPALTSWTAWTKVKVNVVTGDAFKPKLTDLAVIIPPAGAAVSDFILIYLRRPGSTDSEDTYETSKAGGTAAANVMLLGVDLHYHRDRNGLLQASAI